MSPGARTSGDSRIVKENDMNEENRYAPPKAEVQDTVDGEAGNLATRGARLGGAVIDAIISSIVMFPVLYYSGFWQSAMAGEVHLGQQMVLGIGGLVVFLLLNGYLLSKRGQTIGKALVGTRIVSVDDGQILPLLKVFGLRYLPMSVVAQLPYIGNVLAIVNVLFIFRDDRRCVHDLIAGTKVVNA
jgi:uncharacterized RDD family membrane protein YckC